MARSLIQDMTAPYSAMESFVYDAVIADAVMGFIGASLEEFVGEIPKGAHVLDAGCGGGQLIRHLAAARPDLTFTGLDLSHEQIGRAKKRSASFNGRVSFQQGSVLEMPFADASFDVVVSIASIKHWPDQARGVAECARVLRPGGQFLVAEADRGCKLEAAERFVSQWKIPAVMRPLALMLFRTFVAGQALSSDEGKALLSGLPLKDAGVEVREDLPVLLLRGTKKQAKKQTKKKAARKRVGRAKT